MILLLLKDSGANPLYIDSKWVRIYSLKSLHHPRLQSFLKQPALGTVVVDISKVMVIICLDNFGSPLLIYLKMYSSAETTLHSIWCFISGVSVKLAGPHVTLFDDLSAKPVVESMKVLLLEWSKDIEKI
jgi:hypothetical protein